MINQSNSLESPKLLRPQIRKLDYKTFGTSVINSPMFHPFLEFRYWKRVVGMGVRHSTNKFTPLLRPLQVSYSLRRALQNQHFTINIKMLGIVCVY